MAQLTLLLAVGFLLASDISPHAGTRCGDNDFSHKLLGGNFQYDPLFGAR